MLLVRAHHTLGIAQMVHGLLVEVINFVDVLDESRRSLRRLQQEFDQLLVVLLTSVVEDVEVGSPGETVTFFVAVTF